MAPWVFLEPDKAAVSELARVAGVGDLCARVIINRGVTPEDAPGFLAPSLTTIAAPEEEPWRVAARRVAKAIKDGERIGVFGDYDAEAPDAGAPVSEEKLGETG